MLSAFLLASSAIAATVASASESYSGSAMSAFTADFIPNACRYNEFSNQFVSVAESRFAYVSSSLWADLQHVCGRCVTVSPVASDSLATANVTVMVISQFEEANCETGKCTNDIKLSNQAYLDMLNQGTSSRVAVEWSFVDCPEEFVRGGIELAFGDATGDTILTIQPRNFQGQIKEIKAVFADGVVYGFVHPDPRKPGSSHFVAIDDGKHDFKEPFTLVITNTESDEEIQIDVKEQPQAREILITDVQFKK